MKRILFFAAATAVAMSSCSKNEITSTIEDAPQAVGFGTYVGGPSTKVEAKEAFDGADEFGVLAYYTGAANYDKTTTPNFMYNENITAAGTVGSLTWSYAPVKYWPNGVTSNNDAGKISFFAYWPMETDKNGVDLSANTVAGDPTITYTLDQDNAVDLMWGVNASGMPHLNKTKQVSATPAVDDTNNIKFKFKHALARVGFSVKLADDILIAADNVPTTVTINSIEFGGTINATTDVFEPKTYKKATLNLNNTTANEPLWGAGSDVTPLILDEAADFVDGKYQFAATASTTAVAYSAAATIANADNAYFMIIPQDLASSVMRVTYTVETSDANLDGGKSIVKNVFTIPLKEFVSGTAYLYNIVIGINSVKITGESTTWGIEDATVTIDNTVDVTPVVVP